MRYASDVKYIRLVCCMAMNAKINEIRTANVMVKEWMGRDSVSTQNIASEKVTVSRSWEKSWPQDREVTLTVREQNVEPVEVSNGCTQKMNARLNRVA